MEIDKRFTAFRGARCVTTGDLRDVALALHATADGYGNALVFDNSTGNVVDLDLRGSAADVVQRLATHALYGTEVAEQEGTPTGPPAKRGPGRPRLGVVAREVTLLPRHWAWLNAQPGGASVALRRLVEEARRVRDGRDRVRQAQEATYRFAAAMAGNEPGYEEATRALFAGDRPRFEASIRSWPADIARHAEMLAADAFAAPEKNP
ncbi:MAG: DUF2239 family protein [Pseudomonadota bacterium]